MSGMGLCVDVGMDKQGPLEPVRGRCFLLSGKWNFKSVGVNFYKNITIGK